MTTTPAPAPSAMHRFFDGLHRSPLVRAPGGKLGGVCAGLAERLGVSTRVTRVIAVVALFTGIGLPAYLLAWLLLPDSTGRVHLERALRGGGASSIALLVATVLALLPGDHHHHDGSGIAWVVLVAVVVTAVVRRSGRQDA